MKIGDIVIFRFTDTEEVCIFDTRKLGFKHGIERVLFECKDMRLSGFLKDIKDVLVVDLLSGDFEESQYDKMSNWVKKNVWKSGVKR